MFVVNGIAIGLAITGVLLGLVDGYPWLAVVSGICLAFASVATLRGLRRTNVEVR